MSELKRYKEAITDFRESLGLDAEGMRGWKKAHALRLQGEAHMELEEYRTAKEVLLEVEGIADAETEDRDAARVRLQELSSRAEE